MERNTYNGDFYNLFAPFTTEKRLFFINNIFLAGGEGREKF